MKFVYLERPHDSGVLLNLEAVDYCEPNTDGNSAPAQTVFTAAGYAAVNYYVIKYSAKHQTVGLML